MIARCYECGTKFLTQRGGICGKDSGRWLCPECTRGYNNMASRYMVKCFRNMTDLERQAFAIDTLPGWGDFDEEVRNELQD